MRQELLDEVLATPRFRAAVAAASRSAIIGDLPSLEPNEVDSIVDWPYALLCCSILAGSENEEAQDAVLRIAQSCVQDQDASDEEKAAAALLLERLGNAPALELAASRAMVERDSWMDRASPLTLDAIRSRLELGVPTLRESTVQANRFQRAFWTAAHESDWLSVTAATSAGKSFIVRQWIEERMSMADAFVCVYLVPSRALIDEVSIGLANQLGPEVGIHTLPWDTEIGDHAKMVFVMTQERLHLFQQREPGFRADLVIVDEAQKFGDDSRGVLLQQAIDESVRRSPVTQIVFASPLSDNPEALLEGAPAGLRRNTLASSTVTVSQNLFWLNQVRGRPRRWILERMAAGEPRAVGAVELAARPSPASKRLPLLAVALGETSQGNVIYVNGAADAEKVASQVYEALGDSHWIGDDARIRALRELSEATVHSAYALGTVVNRGIAFHYGNMPLLLRSNVESLFKDGVIRYLVCTSTLLEGVNLPCKNLFVRGPRRGRGRPMTSADFWNLAGRAGRWGKEFQGNIFCVDTSDQAQWPDPPRARVRYPLRRATADIVTESASLLAYVASGAPVDEGQGSPPLEALYSYIAGRIAVGETLEGIPGLSELAVSDRAALESAVRAALAEVEIDPAMIQRHPGISPSAMQRLLEDMRSYEDPAVLLIGPPESDDAVDSMVSALGRIKRTMGGEFGAGPRQFMLALLVVNWMRGFSLARIIADRIRFLQSRGRDFKTANVIRECMADVEQIARFEAPKYLSCYLDVLRAYLASIERTDLLEGLPDVTMLLELGVSRTTELSIVLLGLSRTTAIALSEYLVPDEMSPNECLAWLRERDLETLDLPALVRAEITALLARRSAERPSAPG